MQRCSVLVLLLVLSACGDEGAAPDPSMRSAPGPIGTPIAIGPEPYLVVGDRAADPMHLLDRIRTPFLLPNGSVGVALEGELTIRVFDAEGEFVRSLGSRGEGPGEFQALPAAWARGDTIEAFDPRLQRITRFRGASDPEIIGFAAPPAQFAVDGWSGEGWIVGGFEPGPAGGRLRTGIRRIAPDGSLLGEIAEVAGRRRYEVPGATVPDPLSPRAVIRAHGTRVYVGETLTPRITVFDVPTGAREHFRWEAEPPDPVRSARSLRDTLGAVLAPHELQWVEAGFEARNPSEPVSVFWDFLVDEEGFVWVRPFELMAHAIHLARRESAGPGGEWLVFSPAGVQVGTVTVPAELEPVRITADAVIGIRRDELGVESVRVHSLERTDERTDRQDP